MFHALLLDRDGVLIPERDYDYTLENTVLLPGVIDGLKMLPDFHFYVVSNQSGVGRGLYSAEDVENINGHIKNMLSDVGITLSDMVFCPHHPDDNCGCRKPAVGMWEELRSRHQLKVENTVMVGNRDADIAFARNIGCLAVLMDDGSGGEIEEDPDVIVHNLSELADFLLKQ